MNNIPVLRPARQNPTNQNNRPRSEATRPLLETIGTAPTASEVDRKKVMAVSGPVPGVVQTSAVPGIVSSVVDVIGEGFIHYTPPEPKQSLGARVKGALHHMWEPFGKAARWIGSIGSSEQNAQRLEEKFKLLQAGSVDGESSHLSAENLQEVVKFLQGPAAGTLRSLHQEPRDLPELLAVLRSDEVRKHLKASDLLETTCAVVEQTAAHVNLAVADSRVLDQNNNLDPVRVAALPTPLRIVLEDPHLAPQALACLRRGETISAQVLSHTPSHVVEDLMEVSRLIAGGSYLWVHEYLKSGRRPPMTEGDVAHTQSSLDGVVNGVERLVAGCRSRIEKDLDPVSRTRLADALAQPDTTRRNAALSELADGLKASHGKRDISLLQRLLTNSDELKATKPETLLDSTTACLDRFDAFRHQGMKIRIHGESASGRNLKQALGRNEALRSYNQDVLEHTVSADYSNESAEDAKKIVFGIAGLSLVGIPIERYLGKGVMSAVLSTSEDVMGWIGEVSTLRSQGVEMKDIVGNARSVGIVPVLGLSMWGAAQAEKAIMAGHGFLGGLGIGVGSTALTMYTTLSSYLLFRQIANGMVREGKTDLPPDLQKTQAAVERVARDVASQVSLPTSEVQHHVEGALTSLRSRFQGTPDGRALAGALVQMDPTGRAAVASAWNAEMTRERTVDGKQLTPELSKATRNLAVTQVFANPVRKRLAQGVAWCVGLSLVTGLVAPAVLQMPLAIALLGSMESITTAISLKIAEKRHERALDRIGQRAQDRQSRHQVSI